MPKKGHKPDCLCCFCGNKPHSEEHKRKVGKSRKQYLKENPEAIKGKNNPSYKHGGIRTRLYGIWCAMRRRCDDKNHPHYGGRGIKVCLDWLDKKKGFINFRNFALSHGYDNSLTIDRINNDGNYEPLNVQWITRSENSKKAIRDKKNI